MPLIDGRSGPAVQPLVSGYISPSSDFAQATAATDDAETDANQEEEWVTRSLTTVRKPAVWCAGKDR